MTCVFCTIALKNDPHHEIVWQDEAHVAFLTHRPEQPGHMLVIPRIHVDSAFDLSPEAFSALMEASRRLAIALKKARGSNRVALAISGFHVPHAHVHLVPVNETGAICIQLPDGWVEDPSTLALIGDELRVAFKNT